MIVIDGKKKKGHSLKTVTFSFSETSLYSKRKMERQELLGIGLKKN
jgi:hypothetical protein